MIKSTEFAYFTRRDSLVSILKGLIFLGCYLASLLMATAQSRKEIDFNQAWHFKKGANNYAKDVGFVGEEWLDISVPHTFNKEDMQLGKDFYTGDGFYKKHFFVPDSLRDNRLFIRFEGVGSVAEVYVNGRFLGEHRGSFAAFAYELTHSVNYGEENIIMVKANNEARPDIIPVNHFLFPDRKSVV